MNLLARIRLLLAFFIVALVFSGLTAIPLQWELSLLSRLVLAPWSPLPGWWPEMASWLRYANLGVQAALGQFPFLAYGTDWLAFGHVAIAVAFVGAFRDPRRNAWVVDFGIIICMMVIPWALIFGALRGIPFFWRLVDCSFGIFGILPLLWCRSLIRRLPQEEGQNG